ncbi:hypothetical protein VNI00_007158, partial [Paramarasmius palmivorus]
MARKLYPNEETEVVMPDGTKRQVLEVVLDKLWAVLPGHPWLWGYKEPQAGVKVINMDPTDKDFTHERVFKRSLSSTDPSSSKTTSDLVSIDFLYHTLDKVSGEDVVYIQLRVKSNFPVQLQVKRDGLVEDVTLDEKGMALLPVASSLRISEISTRKRPGASTEWFVVPEAEDAGHLAINH